MPPFDVDADWRRRGKHEQGFASAVAYVEVKVGRRVREFRLSVGRIRQPNRCGIAAEIGAEQRSKKTARGNVPNSVSIKTETTGAFHFVEGKQRRERLGGARSIEMCAPNVDNGQSGIVRPIGPV